MAVVYLAALIAILVCAGAAWAVLKTAWQSFRDRSRDR